PAVICWHPAAAGLRSRVAARMTRSPPCRTMSGSRRYCRCTYRTWQSSAMPSSWPVRQPRQPPEHRAMSRIIAIANQKGGVAKTTTCVNLGAALAEMNRRVLVVDMDPQGHATMAAGIDKDADAPNGCAVLLEETPIQDAIVRTETGLDVLPGNSDLTAAEIKLMDGLAREHRLGNALKSVQD